MPPRILPSRPMPLAAAILVAVPLLASPAAAQSGFLFGPPDLSVELRAGRMNAAAHSDIYDFLTENLTLDRKDFAATSLAADAAFRLTDRFDFVGGVSYAGMTRSSESRKYVDQDDQPIEQITELKRTAVSGGLRYYPIERGFSAGRYAWIPRTLTPYVGAGLGVMHYRLEQSGDFVDEADLSVFNDELSSTGNSVMGYAAGGADYWITSRVGLTAEARYAWASAALHRDYQGFNDIDLRGLQASAGFAFRF